MSQFRHTYGLYVFFAVMLVVISMAYNDIGHRTRAQARIEPDAARRGLTPYAHPAATETAAAAAPKAQQGIDPRALAEKQFLDRVKNYISLRDKIEGQQPKLKETDDPAKIHDREKALGEAIRAGRPDAKPGDIFAPAASILRDAVRLDFRHRTAAQAALVLADIPTNVDVHVNDFYPPTLPLATMPPKLLAALPRLPDGVEYRLVGHALILRDINPNLVIDVLPEVVPASRRH